MQVPISWINELVQLENIELESLIEKLTLGGFEVEEIFHLEINNQKQIALEVSSTANRSDSLSIQGLSKEISALVNRPIKIADYLLKPTNWKKYIDLKTQPITTDSNCSTLLAIKIENFSKIAIPKWVTQKLLSSGIVPLNNLLDFQNYVLLETGYPFCFYDFDKICSKLQTSNFTLSISAAKRKQKILANNNLTYELDDSILTVNANELPIGIGGLIEAQEFAYSNLTNSLLIEGSIFNAAKIRQQSRKLGLRTDRSARYEKSLKNTYLIESIYRLISLLRIANPNLICKLHTSNQIVEPLSEAILLKYENINEILGPIYESNESKIQYISYQLITDYLTRLNFEFKKNETNLSWEVKIPHCRTSDITREIDLIEEIGRLHGFNNFLTSLPKIKTIGNEDVNYKTRKKITNCLLNLGFNELIHYSLVNEKTFLKNEIQLINPLVSDYSNLRVSLLPNLIKTVQENLKQKNVYLEGFEYGHVFNTDKAKIFKEKEYVAGIFGGIKTKLAWSSTATELGWFEAKGKIEQLFNQLNILPSWKNFLSKNNETIFHPYRSAELYLEENVSLGVFGQIHPILANQLSLSSEIYLFEFDMQVIAHQLQNTKLVLYKEYSTYPKIIKDLSFIVKRDVPFKEIQETLYANGTNFLSEVNLLDEYRGQPIPDQQTSLCLQLIFQSSKKTLENKEIENIINKLQLILITKFNAIIRI
jgi:phenylalanyl-tRNA synthetase beta chain|uniref:Phenylalanine--tRNA ligase beta subunit, chloroplastic n=1 Tax=Didymosphenia geminata TaxID=1115533 RepID=A0A023HAQ7_9STRA|nr:phenylalanine-tRNA ligase beta subunit [Didymosphenia geminata]AGH28800.1 phenylalanine-tRNA ligase beta subunit [Didymosphenia geminata]